MCAKKRAWLRHEGLAARRVPASRERTWRATCYMLRKLRGRSREGGFGPTERNADEKSSRRVGPAAAVALRFSFRTRDAKRHACAAKASSPSVRSLSRRGQPAIYQYSASSGELSQGSVSAPTERNATTRSSHSVGATAAAAAAEEALRYPLFRLAFSHKQELETAVVLVVAPHDLLVADPGRTAVDLLEVLFPTSDDALPLLKRSRKGRRHRMGSR